LRDDGIAAACLLAVLGIDAHEEITDEETARRYTGALLLVRGLRRLDHIAKLLTTNE
jgi:hypothetical protein